jgi:hypothetical protein
VILVAACLLFVVAAAAAAIPPGAADSNGTGAAFTVPPGTSFPYIGENRTPGTISRTYAFTFGHRNLTLNVTVGAGLYYGAQQGEKAATADPATDPASLAPEYFRAFTDDPRQEDMYRDLLVSFRALRQEHGWDADTYLELITYFVQDLPYDNRTRADPGTPARFPAETITDGTGDCDDKSLLLAGLLSREGYNVSLLFFLPEHHMAVGIAGDEPRFRGTGYLYIETTHPAYIGETPPVLLNGSLPGGDAGGQAGIRAVPASDPIVIRVGNGERTYGSGNETAAILAAKEVADGGVLRFRAALDNGTAEDTARYRALMLQYAAYAGLHNRIVTGRNDRAATFRVLQQDPVAACANMRAGGACLLASRGTVWQRAGCALSPRLP